MPKKPYWFAPKQYGYGLTPVSWQGWLATVIFTAIVLLGGIPIHFLAIHQYAQVVLFIGWVALCSVLFMYWAKPKTNGAMRWRWGGK